jgi:hypothetical protein
VTDDAPTPTVAPPADTPTPTPSPTPTAPAPTPTPTVAAPTPTVAAPTETPTTIPVTGDLGSVYWSNADVQQRLGAPTAAATSSTNQVLGFQHGNMYLRGDTNEIYVMVQYGGWDRFANTATTDPPSQPGPDQDTWIPGGAFGVLWSSESSVSDELGYAGSDSATIFTGEFQQFEGGVMLSTPTDVLMFYNDGTWDWLPIVSDSGATTTP